MSYPVIRFMRAASLVALLAAGVAACSDDNATNTVAPVATSIAVNAGSDAQSGTVGQALAQPISVHVADQNGASLAGALVTWTVVSGGGSVSQATSTADATGNATAAWTLGTAVGADSLRAALPSGASVTLSATASAGPVASLVIV